ncbi:MAG: DUF2288 domain-containing protein [Alkalimonas sp.]|nr:DUF2288 domain-containing protein [Alkalimonas sp.]
MTAVTPPEVETPELIKAKITSETARINWLELQKFYAAGSVIAVAPELDLVEVAFAFSQDHTTLVQSWLEQGSVARVSEQQAQQWFDNQQELWAVVISPWVLVQDKLATNQLN